MSAQFASLPFKKVMQFGPFLVVDIGFTKDALIYGFSDRTSVLFAREMSYQSLKIQALLLSKPETGQRNNTASVKRTRCEHDWPTHKMVVISSEF